MTNNWETKMESLAQNHKVSSSVLSITHMILSNLPSRVTEECVLEKSDGYGVIIRWGKGNIDIHQASVATIFVWLAFNRLKADKITTSEERVFTDEDTLRNWLSRHSDEL